MACARDLRSPTNLRICPRRMNCLHMVKNGVRTVLSPLGIFGAPSIESGWLALRGVRCPQHISRLCLEAWSVSRRQRRRLGRGPGGFNQLEINLLFEAVHF